MKVWASALLLALAACAAPPRPADPPAVTPEARAVVDRLRIDPEYRPAPQGAECVSLSYAHPPRAYFAVDCWPEFWGRTPYGCMSAPYAPYRPYSRRRFCD